jgi:hypothetical protein
MTVAKKITAAANINPATIFPLKAAARRAVGPTGLTARIEFGGPHFHRMA